MSCCLKGIPGLIAAGALVLRWLLPLVLRVWRAQGANIRLIHAPDQSSRYVLHRHILNNWVPSSSARPHGVKMHA
jgi:hypothetical protein